MRLPPGLIAILQQPSSCYLSTLLPDGAPHVTQTWVDTDGQHIIVNTVLGFQKVKNIDRDPRVALAITGPGASVGYYAVRGKVVSVTAEGARDHIEKLSHRYLGIPYPWYKSSDQVHLIIAICAQRIIFVE